MVKLNPDDIEDIDNAHPIELFRRGINADETLSGYTAILKNVLCTALEDVLHGTYEERAAEFVKIGKEDPIMARSIIIQLMMMWNKRAELEPSDSKYMSLWMIRVNLSTIKKLMDMNDVGLAWRRIYEMCPERRYGDPNPGWTGEEIRRMLSATTGSMMHAAILILASSGVRMGGLELKWGDIDPVYLKDGKPVAGRDAPEMSGAAEPACAMMRVYRGESEEYTTFMTPEAYGTLMEYKAEWEAEVGRAPGPEDPVFKKDGSEPIPLTSGLISAGVLRILEISGVWKRSEKEGKPFRVSMFSGFRRRFNKVMMDTPTADILGASQRRDHIMGHREFVRLDQHYYSANPMDLAVDYLHAVPALTVTDEGLLLIELEKIHGELLMVTEKLVIMKLEEETRAGAEEPHDIDRETVQTNKVIKKLWKVLEDTTARLNSLDKGR